MYNTWVSNSFAGGDKEAHVEGILTKNKKIKIFFEKSIDNMKKT